ncbi:hypothetical protein QVD17_19242 [Tagetes erecta]|uniref:Uncharacterized protein n=1 Tax=Tagetes erecta TaxID=13708 RepID=A0AAD8NX51_TARER|nr:hypothetical protein QVD17_19242 [Tagetes erecta]
MKQALKCGHDDDDEINKRLRDVDDGLGIKITGLLGKEQPRWGNCETPRHAAGLDVLGSVLQPYNFPPPEKTPTSWATDPSPVVGHDALKKCGLLHDTSLRLMGLWDDLVLQV